MRVLHLSFSLPDVIPAGSYVPPERIGCYRQANQTKGYWGCAALAVALLLASLRLRDCRWATAHVAQRVWPVMAGAGQSRHLPSSLAFCRRSWATRRCCSFRSGDLFLRRSYSTRFCRVASAWTGSGAVRCFGFVALGVAFLRVSPFLPDCFLLGWPPPLLAGPGREMVCSKVYPTAHDGGGTGAGEDRLQPAQGLSPRVRGNPATRRHG